MHINLRKARKLEQKIQAHVDAMSVKSEAEVRALGMETERESKVVSVRAALLKQKELRESLVRTRFEIRRSIGQANETLGLSSLMTRREEIQALLKLSLAGSELFDSVQMNDQAETRKKQLENGQVGYHAGVMISVPVLTHEDSERFKLEVSELKKELEDIEDHLSQKNLGAKILLSPEAVVLLKSQDLI